MRKDDGGQVYPSREITTMDGKTGIGWRRNEHIGISRRDWLAGLAMQGYLASPDGKFSNREKIPVSQRAYEQADAMIEHGNKT